MSTCVAALYAAAGGAPATTPAQDLVDTWASGGAGSDGFAMVFEDAAGTDAPSIYVKDSGTPANDTDINLTDDFSAFNSFLTYTSPSPKIVRQSDGNLKYCAHNLYLNSASPANQSITVVSGQTYAVTITGSVSVTASGAATGTWTAGTNTFTAATTTLTLGSTSGSGTVHVYRTPADTTYLATTGSIRYALPIQHDSSNNAEGLLVEPASTNLLVYSRDFSNAAYTKGNITVTADQSTGIDGLTSMDRLEASATTTATTQVFDGITLAAGTTVTFSVYAKADEQQYLQIGYAAGSVDWFSCHYDLSDGTVASQAGANGTVSSIYTESLGGGIYRCVAVGSVSGASNGNASLRFVSSKTPTLGSFGAESFSATAGNGLFVDQFQAELGSVPTSPIITTGATATRAVDDLKKATSATPIDITSPASFYAKQYLNVNGTNQGVTSCYLNNSNRFGARYEGAGTRTLVGVTGSISGYGSSSVPGVNKYAASQNTNDLAVSVNGVAVGTDTSVTLSASNGTDIQLYQDVTNTITAPVLYKEILWLPEDMSNTDLESITT